MSKKIYFIILFLLLIIYPVFTLFNLEQVRVDFGNLEIFQEKLTHYQVSIWVTWVIMVAMAVYFKWTTEKNLFFYFIYTYLSIAYIIFGWYFLQMIRNYEIETGFTDDHTLVVLKTAQNLFVSVILTAFLQAAVWWFTRRWHRR